MKETSEISDLNNKLAKLKTEAETLNKQATLWRDLALRGGADEVDRAARAMIAGTATAIADPQRELHRVSEQLDVNRRAQSILSRSLGLVELREGHIAALPAFQRAAAHIPKLAALLAALEAEQLAATRDLRAFEAVDPTGLAAQHPEEKAPYVEMQLGVLRTWQTVLVGDGSNRSKLDYWREECEELGLSLKA